MQTASILLVPMVYTFKHWSTIQHKLRLVCVTTTTIRTEEGKSQISILRSLITYLTQPWLQLQSHVSTLGARDHGNPQMGSWTQL